MTNKKKLSFIIGTRPEAIKMAPVIREFSCIDEFEIKIINTGQHREMVRSILDLFEIEESINLDIMKQKQSLTYITTSVLKKLDEEFQTNHNDMIFVQGDTSSAFSGALSSFYNKIPIAHIEAGLRTESLYNPFPEEANRRLISQIATLHFAPTNDAYINLKQSKVTGIIEVTGNTVIDALHFASKKVKQANFKKINWNDQKVILVTVHRRENWGEPIKDIALSLRKILDRNPETSIIFAMHANPIVRGPIQEILQNHPRCELVDPLNYENLVYVLKSCYLILTDSGGIQEEAPSFSKPLLILRKTTERSEALKSGVAKLVGCNPEKIIAESEKLIKNKSDYEAMSSSKNPFGDGKASKRILKTCINYLLK